MPLDAFDGRVSTDNRSQPACGADSTPPDGVICRFTGAARFYGENDNARLRVELLNGWIFCLRRWLRSSSKAGANATTPSA